MQSRFDRAALAPERLGDFLQAQVLQKPQCQHLAMHRRERVQRAPSQFHPLEQGVAGNDVLHRLLGQTQFIALKSRSSWRGEGWGNRARLFLDSKNRAAPPGRRHPGKHPGLARAQRDPSWRSREGCLSINPGSLGCLAPLAKSQLHRSVRSCQQPSHPILPRGNSNEDFSESQVAQASNHGV